ncbi:hypothetical protein SAMN06265795_102574 [Noviherbaspirillum humi]|uniref:Uncharacterized protein n=1 Tax=Noviherbaspirillum humi TaxID=1688639 RepID=A0A239E8B3_9BURK|nr:hypothetical protein [Noviherbaspirillum humi]SNS40709.1 hypothetical protein SAMN06265795_102574 [Noviherbaspirillum humi]
MRALDSIKQACSDALRDDDSQALARFHAQVDPGSVLEMAGLIESLLTYLEEIDDLTARELVARTRHSLQGEPGGGV